MPAITPANGQMTMVVTLKSGVQIRIPVKEYTVKSASLSAELRGIEWTYDNDPDGARLTWLDLSQVTAVHAERESERPAAGRSR